MFDSLKELFQSSGDEDLVELLRLALKNGASGVVAIPVADAGSRLQCVRAMQPGLFGLLPLPGDAAPRALDVAFLGRRTYLAHCGLAVETDEGLRVLHCPEAACGVALDSLMELRVAGFPSVRWFRHRNMDEALRSRGWAHD